MLKKLVIATAAAGLMASTALAQSPTPPASSPSSPPAATSPAPKSDAKFVTTQTSDQWLASKFIGTDVMGPDNEKVGDVANVLFDKSGQILAYIVGVGGFLGIGAKDVALAPASFDMIPANDRDDAKLKLAMSKDQLKNAPEFKAYEKPRTVGSAPGGGTSPRPAGGGMAPPAPAPSPSK